MGKAARLRALRPTTDVAIGDGATHAFPDAPARTIARYNEQVKALTDSLQSYLNGWLAGRGVDTEANDVRIDITVTPPTYTVTAKASVPAPPESESS